MSTVMESPGGEVVIVIDPTAVKFAVAVFAALIVTEVEADEPEASPDQFPKL